MNIKQLIIDYCREQGLDIVGFTECREFTELKEYYNKRKIKGFENEFEEEDIEKRINPFLLMPQGKTIISIAFPYFYDVQQNSKVHFSRYTLGRDYHSIVNNYLEKISNYIESLGGSCKCFVDSNSLPERYIAVQSGIGFIGKNNTLITEKYGSYIFLGEIITDISIEPDKPKESQCGECTICIKACPTNCIGYGDKGIENNPNKCLSYISQKKEIEDKWFSEFNGRIFGCDTCQNVCPYNKNIHKSKLEDFKPLEYMEHVDLNELVFLDNKSFKEKYKLLSCGWRGKNLLIRNALINAVQFKKDLTIEKSKINSPYIKEYYHRLLKYYQL